MSVLFAYMAGGEGGGGLEVLHCFVRGGSIFFLLFCACVCVWGGGGGRANKKSPKGHYVAYLFKDTSCLHIFSHYRQKTNQFSIVLS